jgi:hypothetical protein
MMNAESMIGTVVDDMQEDIRRENNTSLELPLEGKFFQQLELT